MGLKDEFAAYKSSYRMHLYHGIRCGAMCERAKMERKGAYVEWCRREVGKAYRQLNPLRRLYKVAGEHIKGLEEFCQDNPVTDPMRFTPFMQKLEAWADGRSMNKLMADFKIMPSRDSYTQINKLRRDALEELAETVARYLDACPLPVQEAWRKSRKDVAA